MVARPTKPSPLASSSSANACSGGRYRSVPPTTRNGILRGPIRVTPDVPSMCLLIAKRREQPLSRSTRQSPSSEPATTLERTNQQIDDEREKERQQHGDDETTWRVPLDADAPSARATAKTRKTATSGQAVKVSTWLTEANLVRMSAPRPGSIQRDCDRDEKGPHRAALPRKPTRGVLEVAAVLVVQPVEIVSTVDSINPAGAGAAAVQAVRRNSADDV
jgi:hypothetical protein